MSVLVSFLLTPSCAKTQPMELCGLAVVELEQAAKALTTLDRAGSDRGCLGGDEFVAQTLVRPFFMVVSPPPAADRSREKLEVSGQ